MWWNRDRSFGRRRAGTGAELTSLAPDQRREQINLTALRERRKEGSTVDRAVDGNRNATLEDRPQLVIKLAQACEQLTDGCRFHLELGHATGLRHERAAEPYAQHAVSLVCFFMPTRPRRPSLPPRRCGSCPFHPRRSPEVRAVATSAHASTARRSLQRWHWRRPPKAARWVSRPRRARHRDGRDWVPRRSPRQSSARRMPLERGNRGSSGS